MKIIKEEWIAVIVAMMLVSGTAFACAYYIGHPHNGYKSAVQPKSKPHVQPVFNPLTEIMQQQAGHIPETPNDSVRSEQLTEDSITIAVSHE